MMSIRYGWLFALLLGWAAGAAAGPIQIGKPLPALSITDHGQLVLHGDDIDYRPWSTSSLGGKPTFLLYMAGRKSADRINHHVTDVLDAAGFSPKQLRTVTIINLNDVLWMTGGFVVDKVEQEKRQHPQAVLVLDKDGIGRKTWQLKPKSSAIIVLDSHANVLFFKDGKLNDSEIEQAMTLLRNQVGSP